MPSGRDKARPPGSHDGRAARSVSAAVSASPAASPNLTSATPPRSVKICSGKATKIISWGLKRLAKRIGTVFFGPAVETSEPCTAARARCGP